MRLVVGLAVCLAATLAACHAREGQPAAEKKAPPSDMALPADMIFPVYPVVAGAAVPNDPLATKLCDAVVGIRAARRAACCNAQPTNNRAADCARTLSAAIAGKAVRLDDGEIARCAADLATLYDGCNWVGFEPLPIPDSCRDTVHGLLPARSGCRSSLECEKLLHCEGLTDTTTGVCRAAKGHGYLCAPASDALVDLLDVDRLEASHAECAGHCERGRCATPITPAGPCAEAFHCGPGFHCAKQRCVAGWLAQPGQPCTDGRCEGNARCLKNLCTPVLKEGGGCVSDDECAGRCVRENGDGHCAPACTR